MKHETLDKIPDSALSELSETGEVSDSEILQAGNIAENSEAGDTSEATDINTGESKPENPKTADRAGSVISGEFAVNIMDFALPAIVVLLASLRGYKVRKSDLQLTDKERKLIEPAMQAYLDSLNIKFDNPLHNLIFVLAGVYGAKAMEIIPKIERIPKNETERVKTKVVKMQRQKQSISATIEQLKGMPKAEAIELIDEKRKKGKADATAWYNKNVK